MKHQDNINNEIKALAEKGHADAQYELGKMYETGDDIPQDYKQAVYWYTKASDQGHPQAQYRLGYMYKQGQGVEQDHKKRCIGLNNPQNKDTQKHSTI